MSLLASIVVGLIAGFVFSRMFDKGGGVLGFHLFLGALGATTSRAIAMALGLSAAGGISATALAVSLAGAIALLILSRRFSSDPLKAPAARRRRIRPR